MRCYSVISIETLHEVCAQRAWENDAVGCTCFVSMGFLKFGALLCLSIAPGVSAIDFQDLSNHLQILADTFASTRNGLYTKGEQKQSLFGSDNRPPSN